MSPLRSLLLCAFLSLQLTTICQTLTVNQVKYWDYRARLTEDFMVVGQGQAKSIPAGAYEPEHPRIQFADVSLYLGWYLATLSTEYHLSSKGAFVRTGEGKDIKKKDTLLELYYALLAMERLDRQAEPFFDENATPALNGFFMRDDVPKTEEYKELFEVKYLDSDYSDDKNWPRNEASHDQIYHLLMGIMTVRELIPAETQVNGRYLRQMAIDQGIRIIEHLKVHNWRVVNPARIKKSGKPEAVHIGHQAYIFSEGLDRILKELKKDQLATKSADGKVKKEKKKVSLLYSLFWGSMRSGLNPTYAKNDNRHMALTAAAIGNGWKRNTYRKLLKRGDQHDWYLYPLINRMMYPDNRGKKKDEIMQLTKELLDRAPAGGPYNPWPERREAGWGAPNMFFKDKEYQKVGREYFKDKHWNGLDYMLLHNLYLIHKNGLIPD